MTMLQRKGKKKVTSSLAWGKFHLHSKFDDWLGLSTWTRHTSKVFQYH